MTNHANKANTKKRVIEELPSGMVHIFSTKFDPFTGKNHQWTIDKEENVISPSGKTKIPFPLLSRIYNASRFVKGIIQEVKREEEEKKKQCPG